MSTPFDPSSLPPKRVGAGVLLRDSVGRVLLVEPTYKDHWEIPGGLVEVGESPREAAARECMEELGVEVVLGLPVCIHYAEGARTPGEGIMFVFDAGRTDLDVAAFTLPPDELRSARFVHPADLPDHLHEVMVKRILASIDGSTEGRTVYLER